MLIMDLDFSLFRKNSLKVQCRTAKLWIMHLDMVGILKVFFGAERTGNLKMNLRAVGHMLALFAAVGHNTCAKCARCICNKWKNWKKITETFIAYIFPFVDTLDCGMEYGHISKICKHLICLTKKCLESGIY